MFLCLCCGAPPERQDAVVGHRSRNRNTLEVSVAYLGGTAHIESSCVFFAPGDEDDDDVVVFVVIVIVVVGGGGVGGGGGGFA